MRRIILSVVVGLALGLTLGLLIGWVIAPVEPIDSPMRDLAPTFKDDYTVMVAQSFHVDGDLNAAIERLTPLGASNVFLYVREVTERFISQTAKEADIRDLVNLSCAMGHCTPPMQPFRAPGSTAGSGTGS
jgi:hypothetical protein